MKIVSIFEEQLFSFHFEGEKYNEYDRLIESWTDVDYLYDFAKRNTNNVDIDKYVSDRLEDAEQIIDLVEDISSNSHKSLDTFFQPLHNSEYSLKELSLQKGKTKHRNRKNHLRIYAIRIDVNCFVITGGVIKLSQTMQENVESNHELTKLKKCRSYLKENGVYDNESFFELIFNDNE